MAIILVVDDDRDVHARLSRWLARAGYGVLSAYDGEEGLKAALETKPDLVITDLVMPCLGGYEVVSRLRAAGFLSPIIAFFGGVTAVEEETFLKNGASAVISKAEDSNVLLAAVARLLKIGD